ncbi:MAG: ABC transporter substrate-binding protein [bacterium]
MKGLRLSVLTILCVVLVLGVSFSFAQKKYGEAPMLAELVKAGKLPPVEKRLPDEPMVLGEGVEIPKGDVKLEVGQYGGTLRIAAPGTFGGGEWWALSRENLLNQPGLGVPGEKPGGNILKGYEASKDGKTFTLYMRKGMKWSDGQPLTTEDVRFCFEDVWMNEKLTPVFPAYFTIGGKRPKLEIIDTYTYRLTFPEPYGLFPYQLSLRWRTWDGMGLLPKHYLKQFHIKYTPLEKMKPLLDKQGLGEEWWRLFEFYSFRSGTITGEVGCPTLTAWVLVDKPQAGVSILERNPYYFKVDMAGNQLPYIDKIRWEMVARPEMIPMKIFAGEIDLARQSVSGKDIVLFKENEEKGGYRAVLLKFHCPVPILFNYSHPEKEWRDIVSDVRFRRALNLAINRDEIIDSVYFGLASPSTIIPSEYNPEKANRILDEMGLDKRDAEGWRLRPDGKRMELYIESSAPATDFVPLIELVVDYWKKLGLYTTMKVITPELLSTRISANEVRVLITNWWDLPVALHNYSMTEYNVLLDMSKLGAGCQQWYASGGKAGFEPPGDLKRVYTLFDEVKTSTSPEEMVKKFDEWVKSVTDNLFMMPPVEDVMIPLVVNKNIGNVPDKGYQIVANFAGELFFFRR